MISYLDFGGRIGHSIRDSSRRDRLPSPAYVFQVMDLVWTNARYPSFRYIEDPSQGSKRVWPREESVESGRHSLGLEHEV